MDRINLKVDWWLIIPALLLAILGLVVLRSVAPDLVVYQTVFLSVAIIAFIFFATLDYQILVALHLPIYITSLIFLLTPFIFGSHSRGALRWLQFGQVSLQPSEIIKPFLLLTFALLATSSYPKKGLWLILSFTLPAIIIFFQPDLGTTLVLAIGWVTIFFSQFSLRRIFFLSLTATIILLPLTGIFLKGYQKDRLLTFINPYQDPLGKGYQVIQSVIAVGSGQFFGRGLGHGTQSQLRFLPERHTDFIFASLSEELGFVGAGLVLILFVALLRRIYYLSQATTRPLVTLYCLGVLTLLTFQTFINIGMNIGLAPITGITLPFLSYGGSSLMSLGITLGLITSMARHTISDSSFQIS